jgi:SAM-dependent methyltransferase
MDDSLWDQIELVERDHWWSRGRREIISSVLSANLPAGARVLDVGCGTGFILERLLQRFDAWGLEPEESVRVRCTPETAARVRAGSAFDLRSFDEVDFDAILLLDVIEHLDDDVGALRSVQRKLAPGGLVVVTVPANPELWSSHDERNAHRRRYTRPSLEAAMKGAGLTTELVTYFNSRLYPLALLHRKLARWRGRPVGSELRLPPRAINAAFTHVFAGEARALRRGYRSGLSLIALARPAV